MAPCQEKDMRSTRSGTLRHLLYNTGREHAAVCGVERCYLPRSRGQLLFLQGNAESSLYE